MTKVAYRSVLTIVAIIGVFGLSLVYSGTAHADDDRPGDGDTLAIEVEKSVSRDGEKWEEADHVSDALEVTAGAPISWRIEIENESGVTVTLEVSDTLDSTPLDVSACRFPEELGPDKKLVCELADTAATDDLVHTNQITVTATHNISSVVVSDVAYYVLDRPEDDDDGDDDRPGDGDTLAIEVEKSVSRDGEKWEEADRMADALEVTASMPISWRIEIENESGVTVTLEVSDTLDSTPLDVSTCNFPDELGPDKKLVCELGDTAAEDDLVHTNQITVTATHNISSVVVSDVAYYVVVGDSEGCGVGYWKNHTAVWEAYEPADVYSDTLRVSSTFSQTLIGALNQGGGLEQALGRQAVAALLNAAHSEIAYAYTVDDVITKVQDAYYTSDFASVKDLLENANEAYCPLGGPSDRDDGKENNGVGSPKYWKERPDEWPAEELEIGQRWYHKWEVLDLMDDDDPEVTVASAASDATYPLFSALAATKLNIAAGNDDSCVSETVGDADSWLAHYPVGSGVATTDPAWANGDQLLHTLSDYNSGALCAPSREAVQSRTFLPLVSSK